MNALFAPDSCKDFLHAFQAAQKGVVMSPFARDKEWQACCDVVQKYIDDRVEEAVARVSIIKNGPEESRYVRLIDELAKVTTDRMTLRYQILSVFSPAHDTVAVTLGNFFFHLARNQSAWSRLREEILPTIDQPLTHKLLSSYKYLNWTLRESEFNPTNTITHIDHAQHTVSPPSRNPASANASRPAFSPPEEELMAITLSSSRKAPSSRQIFAACNATNISGAMMRRTSDPKDGSSCARPGNSRRFLVDHVSARPSSLYTWSVSISLPVW